MGKLYATFILLALTAFLSVNKSYCQPYPGCAGGSADGHSSAMTASCAVPSTIFMGGIHQGFASNFSAVCSTATDAFFSGGSYDGYSGDASGGCTFPPSVNSGGSYDGADNNAISNCPPPVSVLTGGSYDGVSGAEISNCNPPSTILIGGEYDGVSGAAISPCSPPATVLIGGSFDGISLDILSVCEGPPTSIIKGGSYDGIGGAILFCVPVNVQEAENKESFMVNLYPNPASGDFSISFTASLPKKGTITINDVLGNEMASEDIYPSQTMYSFKAKRWAEGVYFIKIISDDIQVTRQLMVIKNGK